MPNSVWTDRSSARRLAPAILLVLPACMVTPAGAVSDDRQFSRIRISGSIENDRITEAGGLARSHHRDDLLWTMNDGGPPVLYAVGTDGSDYGSLTLRNASNYDWKDLSAFELDGKPYLLIADTGDNEAKRPYATIYVVEEPEISRGQHIAAGPAWQIRFSYPDGPLDCESVAVDLSGERTYS